MNHPVLSVVVPLYNESENVRPLVENVRHALAGHPAWELIMVDDGSTDGTAAIAATLVGVDGRIRVLELARNYGQAAATQAGFDYARGRVVVTMDGDLQNDPRDIPRLLARLDDGFDLVAGYRARRHDALLMRRLPSAIANWLIRRVSGVAIQDNGCALRAYRRDLLTRLHLYADMHRFLPVVAAATAGARIAELPVRHHARRHGRSKYGLSRAVYVALDLLVLRMLGVVRRRPFAPFAAGTFAALALAIAFGAAAFVLREVMGVRFRDTLVFPAASLLWLGLACHVWMLGMIPIVAFRRPAPDAGGPRDDAT